MTQTPRDWQKDMARAQFFKNADPYNEWAEPSIYWLQEAKELRQELSKATDAYVAACKAGDKEKARADAAEDREQRLKETWQQLREIVSTNATGGRGEDINDYDIMLNIMDDLLELATLYPDTPAPTPEVKQPGAARPIDEWHEDYGDVLWWTFPIEEPPYCGSPLDVDWPGYHTHWTPLVLPAAPVSKEGYHEI